MGRFASLPLLRPAYPIDERTDLEDLGTAVSLHGYDWSEHLYASRLREDYSFRMSARIKREVNP